MAFGSSASRGNNPVEGRARSLFIPDRNYSLTKYLADADGGSKRILPSRPDCWSENFQNMQENRLPGERPDRHPAAGIWERTSPRFRRDRSRRDACPTLRPRPENNPVKGQARNIFIPDRLIPDHATIEVGFGAIPQAVTNALGCKQGFGVHSGAIGDGIADLMEAGIVDTGTRHDLNCVPPYIEIPLLEIEFGVAILRRRQFIPCQC